MKFCHRNAYNVHKKLQIRCLTLASSDETFNPKDNGTNNREQKYRLR